MGIPFEAFLPYGIMLSMFGFSAWGLSKLRMLQNGGKRPRHSIDNWDRQSRARGYVYDYSWAKAIAVMERDRRITGYLRGQSDRPEAPPGFEINNPWKVERRFY